MNRRTFVKAFAGLLAVAAAPTKVAEADIDIAARVSVNPIDWTKWNTVELKTFGKGRLQLFVNGNDHTFDDEALKVVGNWSKINGNCLRIGRYNRYISVDLPEEVVHVAFELKMPADQPLGTAEFDDIVVNEQQPYILRSSREQILTERDGVIMVEGFDKCYYKSFEERSE